MTSIPQLSTDQIAALGAHAVHQLACSAVGTLTTYRLILGRCLLAVQRSEIYLEFGCSGAVHYAVCQLGLSAQQARSLIRVTRLLEELPLLTLAAEEGWLPWSKLREVARVATPETERYWLEMCKKLNYHDLERLVVRTRPDEGQQPVVSQLRLQLGADALQVLERTIQVMCQEAGRALSPAEVLELVCADYLARHAPLEPELDRAAEECNGAAVECSARNIWEAATACQQSPCPGNETVSLPEAARAHWENPRLRFNPEARGVTPAQRAELVRRDGYRCKTPGCPHHLFLEVHHIKFYAEQGRTVPDNLVCLCWKCHRHVHQGHLRIEGQAPHHLTFRDAQGRNLNQQSQLQLAEWLDFFVGWRGQEQDSHQCRAMAGPQSTGPSQVTLRSRPLGERAELAPVG
jgi:hypothetical protein